MKLKNLFPILVEKCLFSCNKSARLFLSVVMISLLAPNTVARAQQTYAITTDGNCEVYDADIWSQNEPLSKAAAGTELEIRLKGGVQPTSGKYFTGEYTVNGVSLGANEWGSFNSGFTMPAKAVTVAALQATKTELTFDFTTAGTIEMPTAALQLFNGDERLEGKRTWSETDNCELIDFDGSGTPDMKWYFDAADEHCYVERLATADAAGSFSFSYTEPTDCYSSITFIFRTPLMTLDVSVTFTETTYDGQAHALNVSIPEGATITYADTQDGTYSATAPTFKDVVNTTIYYKVTKQNYEDASGSVAVKINKKPITVTAENLSMAFGDTEPVLTYTIEGLVEGDNVTIELQRTVGNEAGTYDITLKSISGDDNYSVTFVKGTFTIKKEANISNKSIGNPENLAKDETCEVPLLDTEYAPSEKELSYFFTPVSGVTVDAVIKIALESTSGNKAIYKVKENRAEKLTFGDVEWKESGALLTRPANLTFSGADVDASKIHFTNIKYLETENKMTLVEDFGSSVGVITGSAFTVASGLTGEGHLYFESDNIDYIVTKGTEDILKRDPREDGEYDEPDGSKTTIQTDEDGTQHITNTKKNDDGSITVTDTYIYEDGSIAVKETVTNTDGSMTVKEIVKDADGTTHKVEETTNPDGTKTSKETTKNPVQLVGTVTVTGSNGESTGFGVIKGGKDISISEITNQPIAIEIGKEGAMTIEKTTKESFLANSTLNKSESTTTLRVRSGAFKAGMTFTLHHQRDGSWKKITQDGSVVCVIVNVTDLARRHSATRGAKAARPFFRIDYSGANITCKPGDVELQAAEEAHGINRGDEQDIIIESGKTYDILTDKNLILTLQPSESDFLLTSFTMIVPEDSDPNDINGDGDVNAVDLVKAIAAGKTQAEIDAIVNSIMGK